MTLLQRNIIKYMNTKKIGQTILEKELLGSFVVCANVDLAMVCELLNTPQLKQVGI